MDGSTTSWTVVRSIVYNVVVSSTPPGTLTPTGFTARAGIPYYWRVRAHALDGSVSTWTATQSLTATITTVKTQVGVSRIGRPFFSSSQSGSSRIARRVTRTQSGRSRILNFNGRTTTQVGSARISNFQGALKPPISYPSILPPGVADIPQVPVKIYVESVVSQILGQMTASVAYSQVTFDPSGLNTQKILGGVDVIQEDGAHDICVVQVRGVDSTLPEFETGTPIHARYGWSPSMVEDFYGYVNHVTPPFTRQVYGDSVNYMDVVCVGASYVFKQGLSRIYKSLPASSVVESLANNNYFSTLIEKGDTVWDQLVCSGISAWEFLRDLADRLGWLLMCNKSQLRFMSYDRALARNLSVMPTFVTKDAANLASQETLSSFEVLQGETVGVPGHTKAHRVLSGVDMRTGQPYTVQNDTSGLITIGKSSPAPIFTSMQTDTVSGDSIFAQDRVDSTTQKNRFHIQAHAMVSGDPNVTQGIPVVLIGLDSKNDGIWYVQKVRHHLEFNMYTTELWLGRDSTGDLGLRSTHTPLLSWSPTDPYANSNSVPPSTILGAGRWRSSYSVNTELVTT